MEMMNAHHCLELFDGADQISSMVMQNFTDLLDDDEICYEDYDLIDVFAAQEDR